MKKAIVLLHGWLSDINDFEALLPLLKKEYDHIERVCYDGHGDGADPYDFDDVKTFELVDNTMLTLQKKYEVIDVVGFSMGGALAVYLSQHYDFRKLVLLAPANKYLNFTMPFSRMKHWLRCLFYLEKARLLKNDEEKELYKEKLRATFEDDKFSFTFFKDKYLKRYFRHVFRVFQKIIEKANENIVEIKNPCFIAWGKLDQVVPKQSVEYLHELCINENKKLMIYEDLSHMLILSKDNQKIVNDIIEFLKD